MISGKEGSYDHKTYGDISLSYLDYLVGGGDHYGQDYIRLVDKEFGKVGRIFEWCAGPGFIGFSLLASGLCDSLCLADVSEVAGDACHDTARRNGLEDRVDVYVSDGLKDIPESESWDLVIGNPPHSGTDKELHWGPELIYRDLGWKVHEDLYTNVGKFLAPNSQVIIQENKNLSSSADFAQMIETGGLGDVRTTDNDLHDDIYYIWSSPSS
jgi:methylase of polypeptide subunit release factors